MKTTLTKRGSINFRAYACLITATFFWGCNAVFARLAVDEVSPMFLVAVRWFGVLLLLIVFFRNTLKTSFTKLRPHLLRLFIIGGIGLTGFSALLYAAAYSTSALNIGIVQGAIPIFILFGAFVFQKGTASLWQMVGAVITLFGVVVVVTGGQAEALRLLTISKGDYLMMIACVFYAIYSLGLKRYIVQSSSLELFSVLAVGAFIASLPIVATEYIVGDFQLLTPKGWVIVVLVTLLPSFLSQIFFIQGVSDIGASRAGVFVNLIPIFAAFLSVFVLAESFYLYHAIALALVLGGIALSEFSKKNII